MSVACAWREQQVPREETYTPGLGNGAVPRRRDLICTPAPAIAEDGSAPAEAFANSPQSLEPTEDDSGVYKGRDLHPAKE
jgi:hypothetical protein